MKEAQQLRSTIAELQQRVQQFSELQGHLWKKPYFSAFVKFLLLQKKDTFLLRFLHCQCTNALAKGSRQRRWSPEMIRFWKGFRHQPSPRQCLKYLSGAGNFRKKKKWNSNRRFNLHVPSNQLLDNYEDPGYYPLPPPEVQVEISETASKYAQQNSRCWYIITLDGVHAKSGYVFDFHTQSVLGGEKRYLIEEFLTVPDEECILNIGHEIVQFYLQSIDGGYTEPIGHYVRPEGSPKSWTADKLQVLVSTYQSESVVIIGSSSDGDLFSAEETFSMNAWMMDKYGEFWVHFPDYSHAVQNIRNAFVSCPLRIPGFNVIANSRALLDLRCKYSEYLSDTVLPPVAYALTDKMNMRDCLALLNSKVVAALATVATNAKTETDQKTANAISKFISVMRRYYDIMESDEIPFEEKLAELVGPSTLPLPSAGPSSSPATPVLVPSTDILVPNSTTSPAPVDSGVIFPKGAIAFFHDWKQLPKDSTLAPVSSRAIEQAITGLHKLHTKMKQQSKSFSVKTSVLSTLVTEHE